ncbi:MAG TPA: papain-like cysteine protease family protein [Blastocatellia bacterium]|nr:papain-like cysteine protease family protein [Blastocatellia bacterium]
MPKTELTGFPSGASYKQAGTYSCWAAAARAIINYYAKSEICKSDQELVDAWNRKMGTKYDLSVSQSASAALLDLGFKCPADGSAIPTADEIEAEMGRGIPLLANVGTTPLPSKVKRDVKYKDGHWVVIVGINGSKTKIDVFDPADGNIKEVDYDAVTYQIGQYWENTSYVSK